LKAGRLLSPLASAFLLVFFEAHAAAGGQALVPEVRAARVSSPPKIDGRLIYSFSPNLYAKAYVQWNDSEKRFRTNFLVRWIYKPGANVYVIYNETRELGPAGFLQDRAVMVKASFLFNF